MKEYRVKWEIDIEADDAKDAAMQAQIIMQDLESTATVFEVTDKEENTTATIDLNARGGLRMIDIREEKYREQNRTLLLAVFPEFMTDEELNGGDAVERLGELLENLDAFPDASCEVK